MTAVGTNVALEGSATQSSSYYNNKAQWAIDGNTDGVYDHRSCTHTKKEKNPWWMVTFRKKIMVYEVIITNRADCCGE